MSYARASLVYLAAYLGLTGIGFLFTPQPMLRLLTATGTYDTPFVQFVGAFMIALSIIVIRIIQFDLSVLHRTTLGIRLFFLAVIAWLYASTRDPLFMVVFAVVGLGVALTVSGLLIDGKRSKPG
jgi:hypothetical protein